VSRDDLDTMVAVALAHAAAEAAGDLEETTASGPCTYIATTPTHGRTSSNRANDLLRVRSTPDH
jgi:hypothetical protein